MDDIKTIIDDIKQLEGVESYEINKNIVQYQGYATYINGYKIKLHVFREHCEEIIKCLCSHKPIEIRSYDQNENPMFLISETKTIIAKFS